MTPFPAPGVIVAYDAADQVGRIRTDDGVEVRFGASACNAFVPACGVAVWVVETTAHPLGGLRAKVVNTTGMAEPDRVTAALRKHHDLERSAPVVDLPLTDYERERHHAQVARERAYASLGHLESYVFSTFWPGSPNVHLGEGSAMVQSPDGGEPYEAVVRPKEALLPMWPGGRSAFRVVRRSTGTLIVTDGLSDPFDPDFHQTRSPDGHGFELFAETDESLGDGDPSDLFPGTHINDSWLNDILVKASIFAVEHGGVRKMRRKFPEFTVAIPPCVPLEEFVGPNGYVGLLIGLPAPGLPRTIALPAGEIDLLSVKLLAPRDYEISVQLGDAGIRWLKDRYTRSGEHHRSRAGLGK